MFFVPLESAPQSVLDRDLGPESNVLFNLSGTADPAFLDKVAHLFDVQDGRIRLENGDAFGYSCETVEKPFWKDKGCGMFPDHMCHLPHGLRKGVSLRVGDKVCFSGCPLCYCRIDDGPRKLRTVNEADRFLFASEARDEAFAGPLENAETVVISWAIDGGRRDVLLLI